MQLKNISTLILLFVISFSAFHEIEFAIYDKQSCDLVEYVSEFEKPTDCDEICDVYCEYHQSYVLPQYDFLSQVGATNFFTIPKDDTYYFKNYLKSIKPPIV